MISRGHSVSFQYCPGANRGVPILLLPGLFAGDWIWDRTWVDLKDHGVAVLRLRDPTAEIDITSAAIHSLREIISTILDQVGLSKLVVCGNSLGGLVALDYRLVFPDRVSGSS
jgi:2-hydroxy-6-oxonona-2,4-dienedioate hydrolase